MLQSKPHKEHQLFVFVESQGIEVFYPMIRVKPVNPRSATIRPFFPRYMFVHIDLEAVGISGLQWMPGAIGLVQFEGSAAPVPDHVIHELKKRVADIEAAGGLKAEGLKYGELVRITSGPLAGYEAIFDLRLSGSERAQVLLKMLGRLVTVKVSTEKIEKRRPNGKKP